MKTHVRSLAAVAALLAMVLALPVAGQGIVITSPSGGTQTSVVGTTSSCSVGAPDSANSVCLGSNTITGEGSTADTSETRLAFGDATADRTLTCTGAASSFGCVVEAPAAAASSTAGNGLELTASAATAGSSNAGAAAGGSVTITAGAAARLSSGNANGGDINLVVGAGIGTGTAGSVIFGKGYVNQYGSAAAPPLAIWTTNTGLFGPGGASLGVSVAGTEFLRFDGSSVNVGPKTLGFSASFGTADAGLARSSAGVVSVTNGSTGIGALLTALSVETVATTKAPALTESAELYTNGADVDGQAITLPNDPTVGACYEFALTSTDTSNSMAIAPSAGETLMDAATTCATRFSATAKGATARICAVSGGSGGLWLVMSKNGTWTCS